MHGPEIGFTKNENTQNGYGGDHEFGHRHLDSYGEPLPGGDTWMGHQTGHYAGGGIDGSGASSNGGGHHGGALGYYGEAGEGDDTHTLATNEGHNIPVFLYGTHGHGSHYIHHHDDDIHGNHHGLAETMPLDDHPAHHLFKQFASGHPVSQEDYEHSLDDHIAHHMMHHDDHYGDHHGHHGEDSHYGHHHRDHHDDINDLHDILDHRLANPLDYHIPHFPQRHNSPHVNHFFRHEVDRIAQHVNEFPLVSDKQTVHPSVFHDQLNIIPSVADVFTHGRHRMRAGGRYSAGGALVGAGTVGYGAVGRPAIGIGLAAGGAAGAGEIMGGKEAPIQELMNGASAQGFFGGGGGNSASASTSISVHHGDDFEHHGHDIEFGHHHLGFFDGHHEMMNQHHHYGDFMHDGGHHYGGYGYGAGYGNMCQDFHVPAIHVAEHCEPYHYFHDHHIEDTMRHCGDGGGFYGGDGCGHEFGGHGFESHGGGFGDGFHGGEMDHHHEVMELPEHIEEEKPKLAPKAYQYLTSESAGGGIKASLVKDRTKPAPYIKDALTSESESANFPPTKVPEDSPPAIGPDPKPLIVKFPKNPPQDAPPALAKDPKPKIDPIVPPKGGGGGDGPKPPPKGKPNPAEKITSDTKPKCKRGLLNLCINLKSLAGSLVGGGGSVSASPKKQNLLLALTKMSGLKLLGKR